MAEELAPITLFGISISTAGAKGEKVRLGLYRRDLNDLPTSLILDGGEIFTDTIGIKLVACDVKVSARRLPYIAVETKDKKISALSGIYNYANKSYIADYPTISAEDQGI